MKEGWEYKKLIDVCDFQGGSQPPKSEWINHDSPGYIRMLQIRDFTQSRKVNPEYVKLTNRTKCCFSDDILIGRYGASLGKILTGIAGAYNVAIMRTIPNETLLSKGYLKYYLMSSIFQSFLLNIGGRAAQAGFNKEDLKCLNIPITTLDQQRRIVSYLDSSFKLIDEIKNKALKSLTEAKALFQSALAEAMEPKEGWEEKTLKDIGLTQTGTTPSKSNKAYYGNYIPFIRPSEINIDGLGTIEYNSEIMLSPKGIEAGRKFTKKSILMVCIGATIGKVGYSEKDISCNQQINVLSPYNGYNYKYLYYAMSSSVFQKKVIIEGTSAQATLPIINKGKWEKLLLYIPPLSTQEQIVSHLDSLSSKVRDIEEKYQKMVEECDALKQAMLRDVFE